MSQGVAQNLAHRDTGFSGFSFGELQWQDHRAVNNDGNVHNRDLRRPMPQVQGANGADSGHGPAQQRAHHHAAGEEGVKMVKFDGSLLRIERGNHRVTGGFDQAITDTQTERTQKQHPKARATAACKECRREQQGYADQVAKEGTDRRSAQTDFFQKGSDKNQRRSHTPKYRTTDNTDIGVRQYKFGSQLSQNPADQYHRKGRREKCQASPGK